MLGSVLTIGKRFRPIKAVEMPALRVKPSMDESMNSEQNATSAVEMARVTRAPHMVTWVLSWKNR